MAREKVVLPKIKKYLDDFLSFIFKLIDNFFYTNFNAIFFNRKKGFHYNKYKFSRDEIAIIHIPKTAGTSLRKMLNTIDKKKFINLNKHNPVSAYCKPGKFKYIVFLRNPIDRSWSYYQMAKRKDNNVYHSYTKKGVENFLKHCWEVRNLSCRYLSGEIKKEVDEKNFLKAKENLSKFYFVGFFESFNRDSENLFKKLGANYPNKDTVHYNYHEKEKISEKEKEIIENFNKYDIELFNCALKNFKNKF